MISQCTKFEVSRFTRYEAMNGGAKCRKWGGLGRLGVTQSHRQCHHSISAYDFLFDLIETMRLSCTVFTARCYACYSHGHRVGSHCLRCHKQTEDGRVVYITTCIPTQAMGLCLSVSLCLCLSQVGVLLKRLSVGSNKQHHMIG